MSSTFSDVPEVRYVDNFNAWGNFDTAPSNVDVTKRMQSVAHKRVLRRGISLALLTSDIVSIVLAFVFASWLRLGTIDVPQIGNILFVFVPIFLMFSFYNNAHHAEVTESMFVSIRRGLSALLLASVSLMLVVFFLKAGAEFSRIILGIGLAISAGLITAGRATIVAATRRWVKNGLYSILSIYDGVAFRELPAESMVDARQAGIRPDLADAAAVKRLGLFAHGMDRIVVNCRPDLRQAWSTALKTLDVPSEIIVPELDALSPLALRAHAGQTSLLLSSGHLSWNQRVSKRLFDILVSTTLLIVLSPLLVIVALAIKLDSPGPVFFRQDRIGLGNRSFRIWKFRSMITDACDVAGDRSTARDDDRISRVGRFIRQTSIDELPQLFNVLTGTMSLVGPRPHASASRAENLLYWDIDVRYWHRHAVKPGLTGLAQVRGFRGSTEVKADLSNRLQADLEYAASWSLLGDIRIMYQTLSVMVHRNAY